MKLSGKTALLALSFALAIPAGARAEVSVFVDFGAIAFGYEDGYWDREHRWHEWQRREDWDHYRVHDRDHSYAWRHDRDRDNGWREEYWHDNGRHKGWYKHHDRDDDDDRGSHGHGRHGHD